MRYSSQNLIMKRYLFQILFIISIAISLASCKDDIEIQESDWSQTYP